MTISAADVIAPVLAATEVVVLLFAGVTGQTRLGDFLLRLVLERNDLLGIALFDMGLAGTVARFATGHFLFPAR